MARILLLSNGHGEDLSGALLAQELQQQGHNVQALPLVGLGSAYQKMPGCHCWDAAANSAPAALAKPAFVGASLRSPKSKCSICSDA